jgi:hypothetical protein
MVASVEYVAATEVVAIAQAAARRDVMSFFIVVLLNTAVNVKLRPNDKWRCRMHPAPREESGYLARLVR